MAIAPSLSNSPQRLGSEWSRDLGGDAGEAFLNSFIKRGLPVLHGKGFAEAERMLEAVCAAESGVGAAAGLGERRKGCHVLSRCLTAGTLIPKEEKPRSEWSQEEAVGVQISWRQSLGRVRGSERDK